MRKRIRLLYLQPSSLFGGAERQAATLTPLLSRHGIDVLPMVGPGAVIAEWLSEQGVRQVVRTTSFPGHLPGLRGLSRLRIPVSYISCGLRACSEITQLVRASGAEVILASLPFAWITGGIVARRAHIPIVWRAGGVGPGAPERTALALVARILPPDLLLCNAEAVSRVFSPLIPSPVEVIPNGVDQRIFHPGAGDPARYRPADAELVVGSAMRLADSKRPRDFVALAARLRASHPKVRCLVAGDGERRAELEQMAREGGADNLKFLGFVADMRSFYRACDVLVLTSRSEGSPNVVLEAMAMGKALVLAAIAPVLELIGGPDTAAWFELGDIGGLERQVTRLLSEAEVRQALGDHALARAAEFSLEECAARLATTVRALVDARTATRVLPRAAPHPPLPTEGSGPPVAAE